MDATQGKSDAPALPSLQVRTSTLLFLVAVFLFGLAKLLILPPFEAFDEAQYWSAIQQTADTGRPPRFGHAPLSADVAAYPGPMPSADGQPYLADFSQHHDIAVFGAGPTGYQPGSEQNYETQHPPLFFLLMAPLYRAVSRLGWPWHFLMLRLACWTLAFVGFCIGARATQHELSRRHLYALLPLPVLWPFLFPQFFEEFTRLTNDALCLALLGAAWWLLLDVLRQPVRAWRATALGVLLGAGLLTKAFFIPVAAGVLALLVYSAWIDGGRDRWRNALIVPLAALLIGAPWYLRAMTATGTLTGAGDFMQTQRYGGLLATVLHRFPTAHDLLLVAPWEYATGLLRMLAGFVWAGTWSFVHPSRVFVVPVVALALIACALYARRVVRRDVLGLAPVFLVAPVVAGLFYHLAVMLSATGEAGGTPGWFFHLFAGPLSLVLAIGWGPKLLMLPLAGYAILHTLLMAWMQVAFFSGCLPRVGVGAVRLQDATCAIDLDRLRLLAMPGIALLCAVVAGACLALAAWIAWRSRYRNTVRDVP